MAGPTPPDRTALAAFWTAAKAADPAIRGDRYRARAFGNSADIMAAMIGFILRGEKRGTFHLSAAQEKNPDTRVAVGDYAIVVDYDGKPAALLTTTALEEVAFDAITAAHTAVEGPGLRQVEVWKNAHRDYFAKELEAIGATFSGDTAVTVEYFKLVYPASDPDTAKVCGLDALPASVPRPSDAAVDSFWRAVKIARPDVALPDTFEVCCFGTDRADVERTLEIIVNRTKLATFRVPDVLEARGQRVPQPGNVIVLIDWDGAPRLALRYVDVERTTFADITERHTRLEEPDFRDPRRWNEMHRAYWTGELARFGKTFSDKVVILVGRFEVLYPKPLDTPVPTALQTS